MEVNRAGINETGVLTALLFQQQPVPALAMIHVWALGGQELSSLGKELLHALCYKCAREQLHLTRK